MSALESIFYVVKKPWMIFSFLILVTVTYLFLDIPISRFFYQWDLRINFYPLVLFTAIGKWQAYAVLFFLLGCYFRYVNRNQRYEMESWFLLLCILIPNLIGFLVKIIVARARPDLLFSHDLFGFYWFKMQRLYWSLPSGHTLTAAALAAGLGTLYPRYSMVFLFVAFLVALSRILLYQHYLSDVLIAFYFSLWVVALISTYFKNHQWILSNKNKQI